MKNLILVTLIAALMCIGCGRTLPSACVNEALDAPVLVKVNNTLSWNKVAGANGYFMKVKWHVQYVGDDSLMYCGSDTCYNVIGITNAVAKLYAFNNVDKTQSTTVSLTF